MDIQDMHEIYNKSIDMAVVFADSKRVSLKVNGVPGNFSFMTSCIELQGKEKKILYPYSSIARIEYVNDDEKGTIYPFKPEKFRTFEQQKMVDVSNDTTGAKCPSCGDDVSIKTSPDRKTVILYCAGGNHACEWSRTWLFDQESGGMLRR